MSTVSDTIINLIDEMKFQEAQEMIDSATKKFEELNAAADREHMTAYLTSLEMVYNGFGDLEQAQQYLIYAQFNINFFKNRTEMIKKFGEDEFNKNAVGLIRKGRLDKDLFKKVNPHYDVEAAIKKAEEQDSNWIENAEKLIKFVNTTDPKFKDGLKKISKFISDPDTSFLLLGETGVGKSYLASEIHNLSVRKNQVFENLNCAGIGGDQLYQTLFGWVKGSHSTAFEDNPGAIGACNKGTLFLDEIGEIDSKIMKGLYTFLDTKKYRPLSSPRELDADVILIFGTNRDPIKLLRNGKWSEEFYNRINDVVLKIPSLKERKKDLGKIIQQIRIEFNKKYNTEIRYQQDAFDYLCSLEWPGNRRTLTLYLIRTLKICKADDKTNVTLEMIKNDPPENLVLTTDDEFESFEKLMLKFLSGWNFNTGNYLDNFIKPILAKVYEEDFQPGLSADPRHSNAMKIIGMNAESRSKRYFDHYRDYKKLKESYTK